MRQDCWQLWPDRGLLIKPDPIARLAAVVEPEFPIARAALEEIEDTAAALPELLETKRIHAVLDALPVYDFSALLNYISALGFAAIERLQQIYAYFASAYVYGIPENAPNRLPAGVAAPLVQLSTLVERPPILAYTNYVLNNWRLIDPDAPIALENLELSQPFVGNPDESWFIRIHIDIEARAARALNGLRDAVQAAEHHDTECILDGLEQISAGLNDMLRTFARMQEGCDPDVYYHRVRPYMFGFNDLIYEGVAEYGGKPQSFRGQTAAQSSIIPALLAGLGIAHEQSALTHHLVIMRGYMPRPHREFITQMGKSKLREIVQAQGSGSALADAYNEALRDMMGFRKLHFHYANVYIFAKDKNAVGTGGTAFMDWLRQLIAETEQQLL
jgi:indoleamine 2,3-dioxygenase